LNKIIVSQDDFGKNHITSKPNCYCHTYYHNNILHLFALPSLVAVIVLAKKSLSKQQILLLIAELSSFSPPYSNANYLYM
jgi:glycerol-3-phosphate O-acyltransferase